MTFPPPSRRTVLRGAAWTAPVVVVAATAPAFAASTSRLAVSYDVVSFRADELGAAAGPGGVPPATPPTPSETGTFAAVKLVVTLIGPPVANLTCTLTAPGPVSISTGSTFRGSETWAAARADLTDNGFTVSPLTGTATTHVLTRTTPVTATFGVKLIVAEIDFAGGDFPLTFTFTTSDPLSPGVGSPAVVVVPGLAPTYLAGSTVERG